jgi:hypothetical protein
MEPTTSGTTEGTASPFRRPPRPTSFTPTRRAPAFGPVPAASLTTAPASAPARAGASAGPVAAEGRDALERRRQSGARWFYWVAGLTLVNSLVALTGQHWRFIIGLGITQFADALAAHTGQGVPVVALVDAALVGGFVLLGRVAAQGRLWAFGAGAAFYALDGLIFLAARDWVGVAFHAFVVVVTVRAFDAARRLS